MHDMFRGGRLINLSSPRKGRKRGRKFPRPFSLSPLLIFLARISSFQLHCLPTFFPSLCTAFSPPSPSLFLRRSHRPLTTMKIVRRGIAKISNKKPGSINFNERAAVQLVIRNPARVLSGKRTVIRLQSLGGPRTRRCYHF